MAPALSFYATIILQPCHIALSTRVWVIYFSVFPAKIHPFLCLQLFEESMFQCLPQIEQLNIAPCGDALKHASKANRN